MTVNSGGAEQALIEDMIDHVTQALEYLKRDTPYINSAIAELERALKGDNDE